MKIYLDFETRSIVDLKKTGTWRYAEDQSTDVLCMAYGIDNRLWLWTPGQEFPFKSGFEQAEFHAHNAFFERAIWENVMVRKYGWPRIQHEQWRCTAARAAALALPRSLESCANALGLPIRKDQAGKRVMMKLCKPKWDKDGEFYKWNEDPEDLKTLYAYCMNDVEVERALDKRLKELSANELKVWQLDQKINERGILVDTVLVKQAKKVIEVYTSDLTFELQSITNGEVEAATQRDRLIAWLNKNNGEFKTLTKADVKDALKLKTLYKDLRRVLEIRQELSKTSTAKYQAITDAVCSDGRLRDLLMYHGASTGRWSGRGVQPQNFPRNTIKDVEQCISILEQGPAAFQLGYENVMDTLSSLLRPMLIASPGKVLYGGDFSAIEARVLFWLAGEKQGLEMFRAGEDLYVDLAKQIFYTKTVSKEQRELGKRGILGAGYGMGFQKFSDTCKAAGLVVSEELAKKVIDTYRQKYCSVVDFWYKQERAAMKAVDTKLVVEEGPVKWGLNDGFLFCRLPSGRCLAYYAPRLEMVETPWGDERVALTFMQENGVTHKWERDSTYGGKLAENITQAVARDLIAEAMLRLEREGYEILLSVHDEIVSERKEVDEDSAIHYLNFFQMLLTTVPKWAEGLPIKAEVWCGKRYSK